MSLKIKALPGSDKVLWYTVVWIYGFSISENKEHYFNKKIKKWNQIFTQILKDWWVCITSLVPSPSSLHSDGCQKQKQPSLFHNMFPILPHFLVLFFLTTECYNARSYSVLWCVSHTGTPQLAYPQLWTALLSFVNNFFLLIFLFFHNWPSRF